MASITAAHIRYNRAACDARRRITFWNRGAQDTYGYSQQEALGRRPQDLLRTEYPAELEEIERVVTDTGTWEGQLVQYTRAGERLVVSSKWAAQYDEDGSLAGLLEVGRNITHELARQAVMLELAPDAFVGIGRDGLMVAVGMLRAEGGGSFDPILWTRSSPHSRR